MKVKIKVVRAINSPEETQKYIDGHFKVLESYGVTKVTSADTSWVKNPNVFLLLVESLEDSNLVLGGGRIQLKSNEYPLPLEGAIYEKDPNIESFMQQFEGHQVAEYCGLWNSKLVSGYGIGSIYLIRIGVAIASFLNLKGLLAFCSPYTIKNSESVGFEVIKELGNEGTFLYPKEGLIATIMQIKDVFALPNANKDQKERIFYLRNNPSHLATEISEKGPLEIHYDLNLNEFKQEWETSKK
ncbi:hypothetical protein A33Q_3197 [Indibacter alkaliphilus LW1]|uniref:Uncharacterized protein n=1 Tax=Indibacter alkaliphilus (strain CCUG 57479 / KCTC 22604 / LW1) TaxID=1189612 RepID=S2DFK1_INDAL|nr:hypothetical protein [Indibacter alkaliphilus]EOZ95835.1 hypothetical protein A33Q_3197 [Indibacter alkaliphilus LW1]